MRIERLQLDGFGRFAVPVEWSFGPGLNVILIGADSVTAAT